MTLINIIKNDENIRRLFGKRELKIIEKQLLGVRLKPSEIVRLSRDIRKKFQAIESLSDYKEEFNLKKNNENKRLITKVKKVILEDELAKTIKKIFLFGSTAEKENTLLSDLDIAVEFDNINEKEAIRFRLRIGNDFSDRLDIQVYNVLPDKIKNEIDKYGKILYSRK
jgi:predicted nucleotidyltransferase